MEPLYNREQYGETTALAIETKGSTAIRVANRWALGWPEKVMALLVSNQFLAQLQLQVDREKDILAEAVNLQHLSTSEILKVYEVPEHPPEPINLAS